MVMEEKILNLHFYQGKSNYLVENNIKEKEYKQAVKAKIAEFFVSSLVLVQVVLRFQIWQVFMQKLKRL